MSDLIQQEGHATAFLLRKKTGEIIPVSGEVFVIGKADIACDYVITDNPAISRIHGLIRRVEDEYYVADCRSTNHIYLNGRRISGFPELLTDNSKIHFGNEEFVFNYKA